MPSDLPSFDGRCCWTTRDNNGRSINEKARVARASWTSAVVVGWLGRQSVSPRHLRRPRGQHYPAGCCLQKNLCPASWKIDGNPTIHVDGQVENGISRYRFAAEGCKNSTPSPTVSRGPPGRTAGMARLAGSLGGSQAIVHGKHGPCRSFTALILWMTDHDRRGLQPMARFPHRQIFAGFCSLSLSMERQQSPDLRRCVEHAKREGYAGLVGGCREG